MYRAWNAASVDNIRTSIAKDSNIAKDPDHCLERMIPPYIKGENFRLEFAKVINNDSLITKEDLKNGFFIIEERINGSAVHHKNYLVINEKNKFKLYYHKFNNRDTTWNAKDTMLINKKKFYNFYNKIQKHNKQDIINGELIITKFSDNKIESFVFECRGCRKCIVQFHKLTANQ
ncbi:hypothetical protein FACS1894178_8830 [Bacteroidia bacterium]|nr:hypothetical protein FACS1894178_8830 [Bacteroidia bacterium]